MALVLGPGVAFSHMTALRIHRVELPWGLPDDQRIHVIAASRTMRPQRDDVVAHHTTNGVAAQMLFGLPVTTPAQTWLHLALGLNLTQAVVLGDALTRREGALTTPSQLMQIAQNTRGAAGIRLARRAADLVRQGTDSSFETRARLILMDAGLPCPEVNHPVHDDDGHFVALLDMSYPEFRIAIEYEGDHHRTSKQAWRRDVYRTRKLEDLGWSVIRIMADDVLRNPGAFVAIVRRALHAAACQA